MMTAPAAVIRKSNSEECRIGLCEFKGVIRLDIRVWTEPRNGNWGDRIATPQGVSLRVESLPEVRRAIEAAEAEARRLGLLQDDEGAR